MRIQPINQWLRRVPPRAIYVAALLPVLWLLWQAVSGDLGPDPVKVIEHQLGLWGLQALIATLLITPIRWLMGISLLHLRRAMGLVCFFYITLHILVWAMLDMQLLWAQMGADILKRPYITVGIVGFGWLIPLAITSNTAAIRRLGSALWRRLHQLTYGVAAAGAVHYLWSVKVISLETLLYACTVAGLLLLRLIRVWWPHRR